MVEIRRNSFNGTDRTIEVSDNLAFTGAGSDKYYYYDKEADPPAKYGWLCFRDESVKVATLDAYRNLSNANDVVRGLLPKIVDATPGDPRPREDVHIHGKTHSVWIEHTNGKFFKPKMSNYQGFLHPTNKAAIKASKNIEATIRDLKSVEEHLEVICANVGELCLSIEPETGKIFLVDIALKQESALAEIDYIRKGFGTLMQAAEGRRRENINAENQPQIPKIPIQEPITETKPEVSDQAANEGEGASSTTI